MGVFDLEINNIKDTMIFCINMLNMLLYHLINFLNFNVVSKYFVGDEIETTSRITMKMYKVRSFLRLLDHR